MPEPGSRRYGDIELRSTAFADHTLIPERHSYEGGNVSPALEWHGVPDGTEELVLVCEDPDAPSGTFTHWVLTSIPPDTTGVAEGRTVPGAVPGRNDFGGQGWGGPRPPVGDQPHRYFFRLHAVDQRLDLGSDVRPDQVRNALAGHVLSTGTLVGLFGR